MKPKACASEEGEICSSLCASPMPFHTAVARVSPEDRPQVSGESVARARAKIAYRAIICWTDINDRWAADIFCTLLAKVCGVDLPVMFWEDVWVPQWLGEHQENMKDLCWGELLAGSKKAVLLISWNNFCPSMEVSQAPVLMGLNLTGSSLW